MGIRNITYEDNNNSTFTYTPSGSFVLFTWAGAYDHTNGTFHGADTVGSQVTFTFPTAGQAVYFYGLRRSDGSYLQACTDCDPSENPKWELFDAVNATDDGKNSPVVLYSHTFDTQGIHNLVVQNRISPSLEFPHSHLTVDRVVISVNDNATPGQSQPISTTSETSTTSSTTSSSATSSSSSIFGPLLPTISVDPPSSVSISSATSSDSPAASALVKSKPAAGAIAGGIVGGVVGLVLLLGLVFWVRRRYNNSRLAPRRETFIDGDVPKYTY